MMKRNILAVLVLAFLMAINTTNAAEIYNKNGSKLDFYGKVTGEHSFTTHDQNKKADFSYGQIGFKGETQINDQMTGYGRWEYRAKVNKDEGDQNNVISLAFVGIKTADAGSLDYGRNYSIVYDVESYTDRIPSFSSESWGVNNYTSNYMSSHSTGLLTYRSDNFFGLVDGLALGIQYQGKNDHDNFKQQANGDGVGMSLGYNFGEGFSMIGAYNSVNRTIDQKVDGRGNKSETWAIGAKYDANNIYLATVYTEISNIGVLNNNSHVFAAYSNDNMYNTVNKAQNFEVIAQYQFDFGLRPSISYVQSKSKDLDGIVNRDMVKYITTGAIYNFNNNFNIYGDYRFNLLNDENISNNWVNSDNQVTVGINYQF